MTSKTKSQGRFTGKHMLIIMVAFFGVIVTVNFTMATFAARTWTGLVVQNSYVESQRYNAKLENARQQSALGWVGTLSPSGSGVEFALKTREGGLVAADRISVVFRRPATEALDRSIVLVKNGNSFTGDIGLDNGRWSAEVEVFKGGQLKWQMNYDIVVKPGRNFDPVFNRPGK